jgi:hypothetical protein
MERVRENLRHPDQARPRVLQDEEVKGPEQKSAGADDQPEDAGVVDEALQSGTGLQQAKAGPVHQQHEGR